MKDWIKQRIQNLSDQLQEPECNNPTRVIAKKEAFEEMLYMIENKALRLGSVVATEGKCCGYFISAAGQTSATICETCGQEKHFHPQH